MPGEVDADGTQAESIYGLLVLKPCGLARRRRRYQERTRYGLEDGERHAVDDDDDDSSLDLGECLGL